MIRQSLITILLAACVTGAACAEPNDLPLLRVGMPSMAAHRALEKQGWRLTGIAVAADDTNPNTAELAATLRQPFTDCGALEVGSCVPTGLGQCFRLWRKDRRLFVVLSRSEFDPKTGPTLLFFHEVALKASLPDDAKVDRDQWDPRITHWVPGSFPQGSWR